MRTKLKLIGCGGHCKVVLDALFQEQLDYDISLCDDNVSLHGQEIHGCIIDSTLESLTTFDGFVHISIGNNKVRERIVKALNPNTYLLTIIHPKACLSTSVTIGPGAFIAAMSILAPDSSVGTSSIINHGAIVDHEVIVGDYTHVAPNVTLGGQVKVGNSVFIGAGAIVLPGIKIGDGAIVGAGAVVTKNVKSSTTVMGVPALPKE
ncbi:acetyltransferase [Legionella waltersii]|uniref:Chloramphenicol acetyltransferase n=1 Tax=Legionella waltersii TaxID=66969 RepID=A0A0W1AN32_9GAMM|nr:acetyltransferase [Legionella waltersii]KTD82727.1 chloramphenicol acetyltransferase [Legionella waltersii]SNV00945.1 acetyltransferase [Legionella waltersii]